jgi:hypothetical protein
MQLLHITNPHFITYTEDPFTIDVLGGVDLAQVERLIVTLRITHQHYPPFRTTLDLYNDEQTDQLLRTLCDKWNLTLNNVSKTIFQLTNQLEDYRLKELKFLGKQKLPEQQLTEAQRKDAISFLKRNDLLPQLTAMLNTTGILGEDENAAILFLSLASYKYRNPFSVLCLAKNGIGKSYLLQKLSECLPLNSYSLHSRISENALYYFDSSMLNGKALLIEDIDWTNQMLQPLATLQTQGRLVNTRATKNKDGLMHSTTFEVNANLCLVACTYADKGVDEASLPFLCLPLNHTSQQDMAVMDYQKRLKAGLVKDDDVKAAQQQLKNVIASLENVSIINPFATLINLPEAVNYPRKSLLLLLNFIEVITYFFQHQREKTVDKTTGEVFIKTHPNDIELAFALLKNNLFRRADELSSPARGFYNWLTSFLQTAKATEFTALDVRKEKTIHPRTLNNYLTELKLYTYIQITGGNKHRGGFTYKLTGLDKYGNVKCGIEAELQHTLQQIWNAFNGNKNETSHLPTPAQVHTHEGAHTQGAQAHLPAQPGTHEATTKRIRIEQKETYTFNLLLQLNTQQPGREFLPEEITSLTGRSLTSEARYLRILCEQGKLNRQWKNRQYYYTIAVTAAATTTSWPVSQNPLSNS